MLISLPFFFGLGFSFGMLLCYAKYKPGWEGIQGFLWRYVELAIIIAALLVLEVLNLLTLTSANALAIPLSALVVGCISGRWYFYSTNSRDRLAFIAAVSLSIFGAALEYQYKSLGFISKFEGAGVKVEFADNASRSRDPNDSRYAAGSGGPVPFSGANRLDFVISSLESLGPYAIYDEKFARYFSLYDRIVKFWDKDYVIDAKANLMAYSTAEYVQYLCTDVLPLAKALKVIQGYHKSEISTFSIRPEFVEKLRKSYFFAQDYRDPDVENVLKGFNEVSTQLKADA